MLPSREALVSMGVGMIAILAGVITPLCFSSVDDAIAGKALSECRTLRGALRLYLKDTNNWPYASRAVFTDGLSAEGECRFHLHPDGHAAMSLALDMPRVIGWRGPYLLKFPPDPWGHRYVAEIRGVIAPRLAAPDIWVISAGPNGRFETDRDASQPQGDDVGLLVPYR